MPTSFSELLVPKYALVKLSAVDRFDVVTRAVRHLCEMGALERNMMDRALEAVLRRERDLATGLECGLAVPHGFCAGLLRPIASIVTLNPTINFEAMDGEPTGCAVVLVEPDTQEGRERHLMILAGLAQRWMQPQVQQRVMDAPTTDALIGAWS